MQATKSLVERFGRQSQVKAMVCSQDQLQVHPNLDLFLLFCFFSFSFFKRSAALACFALEYLPILKMSTSTGKKVCIYIFFLKKLFGFFPKFFFF